jgi:hypothetical protein
VLARLTEFTRRLSAWPGLVFALVFAWKILLFGFSAQPVPANDAFFYDGPVVNLLLHGKYVNPSLALAFPISGTKVFCAYPPLYQLALLPWMAIFGTSALSAMAFHLVLFGIYMLVLFAVLRCLQAPVWCIHLAGAFLFLITFHDRPDSLAHVFGISAIYAWVRNGSCPGAGVPPAAGASRPSSWPWAMVIAIVLALATSLQIGAIYWLLIWTAVLAESLFAHKRFPILPMAATIIVPLALIFLVIYRYPQLWAGFLEHARQTPSFTGLRWPLVGEILKVIRTAPAVIAVAILFPLSLCLNPNLNLNPNPTSSTQSYPALLTFAASLAALAVIAACLFVLTPNMVAIAGYLQPVILGSFLTFSITTMVKKSWKRALGALFICLAILGSTRPIGMTTWGLACAADFGYSTTIHRIRKELDSTVEGQTVVLSSAYLYEAARQSNIRWIHSDWLHLLDRPRPSESEALLRLKPAKLILTQFDFYRRYEPILDELKSHPSEVKFQIVQTANIPAPDSFSSLQKVVQHISWAPVIVTFTWP